jgi:hypothetical protein
MDDGPGCAGKLGERTKLSVDNSADQKATCAGAKRPYVVAYNTQELQGFVYQPRCGKWNCPYCAQANKEQWVYTAIYGMESLPSGLPALKFVTITSRGYVSAAKSLLIFKLAWPRLIRRIAYRQDTKPEYMLVPEHHKSGKLHAHFLITSEHHSDHDWHDYAYRSGLGYQAKERLVRDPSQAGHYISKEVTKQLRGQAWPDKFRRVRLSESWPRPPQGDFLPTWEFETCMTLGLKNWQVALLRDEGYFVKDVGERGFS